MGINAHIVKSILSHRTFMLDGENMPMTDSETDLAEDSFITGLRRWFELHPRPAPATVSALAGLNKSAIRKMLDGLVRSPRHETMLKIAAAIGQTPESIMAQEFDGPPTIDRRAVAVAGRVGGGAEVTLVDDHAKGDGLYHVACPAEIRDPRGVVAVEVVGDSMMPHHPNGSVLFYRRQAMGVPTECLRRICVCEDEDGHAWVKEVRIGTAEGTFTLLSTNRDFDARHGVRLKWAARVLISLDPDLVTRVA